MTKEQGTSKTYSVNEKDRDLIERFVSLSEGCPATVIGRSDGYEINARTIQGYRRSLETEGREGLPHYLNGKTRWVLRRFVADAEAGKLPPSIAVRIDEKAGKTEPSKPAKPDPKAVKKGRPEKDEPAFKEGDRVRHKETGPLPHLHGVAGTIDEAPERLANAVLVDFDRYGLYWTGTQRLEHSPEAEDTDDEVPETDFTGAERGKYADKVHPIRPEGSAEAGNGPTKVANPLHGAEVHMLRRLTLIERSQRRTESLLNDVLDILLAERKGR